MREIKFRVWDGEKYHHEIDLLSDGYVVSWSHGKDGALIGAIGDGRVMGGVVLEQYTGLKDENGKEIYEGDMIGVGAHIVRYDVAQGGYCAFEQPGNNDCYRYPLTCGGFTMDETGIPQLIDENVIGNIHENPELLEER